MALIGSEILITESASGSTITLSQTTTKAVALIAAASPAHVNTAVANNAGTTLLAAALIGSIITRTGPTANFTDTTDTAALIISGLDSNAPTSTEWKTFIRNTTPYVQTLAAGTAVTLAGETVIPANSVGIFSIEITGTGTVTIYGIATMPIVLGALEVNTSINTVGNGTLTAASIVGQVITRSGPTAVFTDTTDTATNLISALPNPNLGQSWECSVINTTAFAQTIATGAGVTLSGLGSGTTIPANATGRYLVTYSGASAFTMQLISVTYNAASGYDPSTVLTQFGSGTGTFLEEGNLNRQISSAGINPGATAADNVLAAYTLPANSFDGVGNRGITITAVGSFAATGNNKRIKIIFNPASATVGSTVGASGTTIADTGTVATNTGGWWISGNVFKYGAANSNTQLCTSNGAIAGAVHGGTTAPALATATENATIFIAITGNAATVATDIVFNFLEVNAMN